MVVAALLWLPLMAPPLWNAWVRGSAQGMRLRPEAGTGRPRTRSPGAGRYRPHHRTPATKPARRARRCGSFTVGTQIVRIPEVGMVKFISPVPQLLQGLWNRHTLCHH